MNINISTNDSFKKPTKEIRDYIPSTMNTENFRQNIQIKFPENYSIENNKSFYPNIPFPEWPNEDEINNFNNNIIKEETLFTDPNNNLIIFPYSLRNETFNNFIWLRPKDIIKQQNLINEINKRLPYKNPTVVKNKIDHSDFNRKIIQRNSIDIAFAEGETSNLASNYMNSKLTQIEINIKKDNSDFINNIFIINNNNQPSSINMQRYYCKFSKWLGSIFQLILDNNLNNKDFIKRIYPQNNEGIPIYNPNGKYWVKLFQMGKFRKIEIDDYILCNRNNFEVYFPQCNNVNEIWPFILTKALIKLYSFKFRVDLYENEEIGDFSFLNALTNYIGVDLDYNIIDNIEENKNFLFDVLSEKNYNEKNILLIAYKKSNENDNKKQLERFSIIEENVRVKKSSNLNKITINNNNNKSNVNIIEKKSNTNISNKKINYEKSINHNRGSVLIKSPLRKAMTVKKKNPNKDNLKKIPYISSFDFNENNISNPYVYYTSLNSLLPSQKIKVTKYNIKTEIGIYYDIIYSIEDFFQSGKFNMERLFPISFSDLKLDVTTKYKQLNHVQKEEYFSQLNKLKIKQQIEKKSRIKKFREEGKNNFFFKITNNSLDKNNFKLYKIKTKYSSKQIEMAKYCIFNNEKYPPIDYFNDTFIEKIWKDEDNGEINFWTKKFYKKLIGKNEFKKENIIYPKERIKGAWINYEELKKNFSDFSIMININIFKYNIQFEYLWKNFKNSNFEDKNTPYVIFLKEENNKNNNNSINNDHNSLLLLFEPNCEKNKQSISSSLPIPKIKGNKYDDIIFSLTFQIISINKETKKISKIENDTHVLKKLFSSYLISNLEKNINYIIIIKGGIIPFGYTLQLFSNDFSFEKLSYSKFLCEFKNFYLKLFNIHHPILPKNNFYVFTRLKITYPEKLDKNIFFYISFNLNYLMDIFLISKSNKKKRLYENKLFSINFNLFQEYYIEISSNPHFNIPQNKFDFEFLYDDNKIKIEQYEIIHPFFIRELYIPNKRCMLFNEILFSIECDIITFEIQLEFEKNKSEKSKSEKSIGDESNLNNDLSEKNSVGDDKNNQEKNIHEKNNKSKSKGITHREHKNKNLHKNKNKNIHYIENNKNENNNENNNNNHPENNKLNKNIIFSNLYNNIKNENENKFDLNEENNENQEKIKLIFEYWKGAKLIFKKDFYNSVIIRNLLLTGKIFPKEEENLDKLKSDFNRLKCYIDPSECPKYLFYPEYKNNLFWKIRVFSSENIQFIKNTIKEDSEKAIKASWENLEPGRALKAKKSRDNFVFKKNNSFSNFCNDNNKIDFNLITNVNFDKKNIIKRNIPFNYNHTSIFMKNFSNNTNKKRLIIIKKNNSESFTDDTKILKNCQSLPSLNSTYKNNEEKNIEMKKIEDKYNEYYNNRKEEIKKNENKSKSYSKSLENINKKYIKKRLKLRKKIIENEKKILDDFIERNNKINEKYENLKNIFNEFNNYSDEIELNDFFDFFLTFKNSIDIKDIKKEYFDLINKLILIMSKFKNQLLNEAIEKEDKETLIELINHNKIDNILYKEEDLIDKAITIISQKENIENK